MASNINNGLFEYYMFGNNSVKSLDLINKNNSSCWYDYTNK